MKKQTISLNSLSVAAGLVIVALAGFGPSGCSDGSDNVSGECGADYACGDGSCIPKSWACDGMNDCSGGDDESKLLCGSGEPSDSSSVTQPPLPPTTSTTKDSGCGDVSYEGYCSGDTVIWCDEGQLMEANCAEYGYSCGYSGGIYDCVTETAAPSSGCGGVSYEGYCDGDVVVWCDGGTLYQADCGSVGLDCGWTGSIYDCE